MPEKNSSVESLLKEMLAAFEEYNPAVIEPFLKKLDNYLSPQQMDPIQKNIDRFDFDEAKAEVVKLAHDSGIEI